MIYINKNITKEELDTVTKELRHYDWRYEVTDEIAPYDYMFDKELAIISVDCVDELCERLETNDITNIMDKAEQDDILLTILVNNSKCEFLCDLDDDEFINEKNKIRKE